MLEQVTWRSSYRTTTVRFRLFFVFLRILSISNIYRLCVLLLLRLNQESTHEMYLIMLNPKVSCIFVQILEFGDLLSWLLL